MSFLCFQQGKVDPPEATRHLDLSSQVWPEDDDPRPETLLYALLGPKGAYTDWHVDMGGSSVWYHLISGCKIFMLAPNTPKNNTTFEKWSTSEQQASAFLGDLLEHCQRVELRAGDTLFLPSGWPHAVSTPEDSFVLGGNFLSPLDYGSIAHVYRSEVRLGVQPKFQFPLFRRLMWHAARCAVDKIKEAKKDLEHEETRKKKKRKVLPGVASLPAVASKLQHRTDNGTSPISAQQSKYATSNKATTSPSRPTTRPLDVPQLNKWERQGLPSLLSLLKDWQKEPSAARRVDIPDEIDNAGEFLEEMEQLLQEIDTGIALNGNGVEAGGGSLASAKAKKMKSANTSPKSGGSSDLQLIESDCGTSSGDDDCAEEGDSEEDDDDEDVLEARDGMHVFDTKDRRRPKKRTKQLASLVQLKEALAARASKPKTSRMDPSLPHQSTNGITSMNRNKNLNGKNTSSMNINNNNKVTVITLSSSSESDCDSEPIYISSSSSSEEDEQKAGKGSHRVRSIKKPSTVSASINPRKGGTIIASGVNRGLKSPVLDVRKNLPQQQQEKKKASGVVYTPPVPIDVQPLGKTKQMQPVSKRKDKIPSSTAAAAATTATGANGAAEDSSPSERAVALKQILEMRKLEQDLHREQRLLETVASGGVALKDSGQKLEARVSARRRQLETMKNTLEGKVLYYKDVTGRMQGPFTSRQLGVLAKAGNCPENALVEKINNGAGRAGTITSALKDKESSFLTVEEAITMPVPLTAVILKEESESQAKELQNKEEVGQANPGIQQPPQQRQPEDEHQDQGGVQKKKRSKSRSRPRKEYNEPYISHNNNKIDAPQQQPQPRQQPQQHQHRPQSSQQRAGPSAWEIAAATTAAITQQESDPIWTFKVPKTGEYKGPYCTAELRRMFLSGEMVKDIMVHDEDGGVSTSLFTLLGVPQGNGGSDRYEIEPYRIATEHKQKQPQQQRRQEERVRSQGNDVKREKSRAATKDPVRYNDGIKEDRPEPEPYAVSVGRQFALETQPPPRQSIAQQQSAPKWGSYADPQSAQHSNGHGSYYRSDQYPPPAAQHAQQPPLYYQGTTPPGSWAAPPPQQQQQRQQRPPQRHVPMSNAPRPMMRAVEGGFHPNAAGGWGGSAAVPPGEGGRLGPMRPAAELNVNQYHQQQQQQRQQQSHYNPPSYNGNGNGYWMTRY